MWKINPGVICTLKQWIIDQEQYTYHCLCLDVLKFSSQCWLWIQKNKIKNQLLVELIKTMQTWNHEYKFQYENILI